MALSPERHKAVAAELLRMHTFLVLLAADIDKAPDKDNLDLAAVAVLGAAAQVGYARRLLELARKKRRGR